MSALEGAISAISKYGGAEPGDRTMVGGHDKDNKTHALTVTILHVVITPQLDPLHQAALAVKQNLGSDLKTVLVRMKEAAERGATDTAHMVARYGSLICSAKKHFFLLTMEYYCRLCNDKYPLRV